MQTRPTSPTSSGHEVARLVDLPVAHRARAQRNRVVGQPQLLERAAASEHAVDERNSAISGDLVALEVEDAQRDAAVGQRARERFDAIVANLHTVFTIRSAHPRRPN